MDTQLLYTLSWITVQIYGAGLIPTWVIPRLHPLHKTHFSDIPISATSVKNGYYWTCWKRHVSTVVVLACWR